MKTKKAFEKFLNGLLFDCYSEEQTIDKYIYLTNKSRGKHCSINHLRKCYYNREMGTLLRRLDPIAFNTDFAYRQRY